MNIIYAMVGFILVISLPPWITVLLGAAIVAYVYYDAWRKKKNGDKNGT